MATEPAPLNPRPRVHDMTGIARADLCRVAANDGLDSGMYREILATTWRKDIQVGDQVRWGDDDMNARTFWVVRRAPEPANQPGGLLLWLELAVVPVTVAGVTHDPFFA